MSIIFNDQPWIRTALFQVITQRVMVISYGYLLGNNLEERSSQLLRGGSLKSLNAGQFSKIVVI